MARFLKPLVRSGGYYPSRRWTPLVYPGGYTTANGGEEPAPPPIEKTITGNPIHILDALAKPVQALSIALEPIQDLHGYDNPWPAGGGRNKLLYPYFDSSKTINDVVFTVNNDGTIKVNGTASARAVFYLENVDSNFAPAAGTYYISKEVATDNVTVIVEAYSGTSWVKNLATVATGASVQFTVDYDGYDKVVVYMSVASGKSPSNELIKPMIRLASDTDPTFAPYSNICPISGWTGAKVTRTGINVWDGVTESGYINVNTGKELSSESQRRSLFVSCKPSTNYVYVNTNAASGVRMAFYDGAKNYVGMFSNNNSNPQSFTTPQNAKYLRFYWGDTSGISINYPATDTSYHAYTGTTYPIPLGQMVYGGTLDVTQGKLTVTMAMVDLGTLTWANISGNRKQCTELTNSIAKPTSAAENGNLIAERYANVNASDLFSDSTLIGISVNISGYLIARTNGEEVSGKLVYELATPLTIQLTAQQVELLQGENNIWSDGEMTLVYLADGNASDVEALNILLGGRYVNNHTEGEPTDREALDIVLGGKK